MDGCSLRPARHGEAPVLGDLAFRSKAYWGYDDEFMAACRDELRVEPSAIEAGLVLVAVVDGGSVVGFAELSGAPPDAELEALFVDPDRIRGAVGTALLDGACDLARARGFDRLLIESDPNAAGFYERRGAILIGDRESTSIPGRRLPLLAMEL